MNKYTAESIFTGYSIGLKTSDLYIAIPKKRLDHTCIVWFANDYMIIKKKTKPAHKEEFPDKWGRDPYMMYYYKWEPYKKKEKVEQDFITAKNAIASMPKKYRNRLKKLFALDK